MAYDLWEGCSQDQASRASGEGIRMYYLFSTPDEILPIQLSHISDRHFSRLLERVTEDFSVILTVRAQPISVSHPMKRSIRREFGVQPSVVLLLGNKLASESSARYQLSNHTRATEYMFAGKNEETNTTEIHESARDRSVLHPSPIAHDGAIFCCLEMAIV